MCLLLDTNNKGHCNVVGILKQDYLRYNRELQENDKDGWEYVLFREYPKVHNSQYN